MFSHSAWTVQAFVAILITTVDEYVVRCRKNKRAWQCAWRARLSAPVGLWSSVWASKFLGAQDQVFYTQLNSAISLYYKNRELKKWGTQPALNMAEDDIFRCQSS